MFDRATVSPGFNGMTMYQTRHSGANIDPVRDFSTLLKAQNEVDGTTLCRPLRNKLETLAQRAEVLLTKRLQVRRLTNA